MKRNRSDTDRIVRASTALILITLSFLVRNTTDLILPLVVSAALLLTAYFGYCPLYAFLHLNTFRRRP